MCGICGYQGISRQGLIQRMMKLIAHRGPDDSDFLEDRVNRVALGHTRLSIIDLRPEGRQPLKNENGSIFLVFNGEIYNYKELRAELLTKGHIFSSFTDSEVLIHLYEEMGTEMLLRLNGIFAFAIYDVNKKELFCARDQLGVKPFYYTQGSGYFAFASELKALLCISEVSKEINPIAVHNHLSLLWSPSPVTVLKDVKKLEPGVALIVKDGRAKRHWRYYDIPFLEDNLISSESECINLIQEKLLEAVRRQLMADVPVGAFLSGGLDSSSVVAMMRKIWADRHIKCYTISFAKGKGYEGFVNDLYYARKVARHFNVDLEEVVIESDIVSNIEKIIYFLDEPQADLAPINIFLICKRAREQGIKVLLSGAGGDDIFAGYRRHAALYFERYWAWLPASLRYLVQYTVSSLSVNMPTLRRIRKLLENASLEEEKRLIAYFFWLSGDKIRQLYTDDFMKSLADYDSFMPMHGHLASIPQVKNNLNRMLYLECKTFLPDHNLNYTDKTSMASGIEVRVPLLDIDFVHLSTRIHPYLKQKGMTGKYIFRKAMEPLLPKEILHRPKGAIPVPLRIWLSGELRDLVHSYLSRERIKRRGWFNPDSVCKLIKDNEQNKIDATYSIWAMVVLEIWADLFLDRSLQDSS